MTTLGGTDWAIQQVVRIVDGDTIRVIRRRTFTVGDGLSGDIYDTAPAGVAIRLITLDTPERTEDGYSEARLDVIEWLTEAATTDTLRIETWPGGGFDRLLGDVYVASDRADTLSRWMIVERGWLPYVAGV